MNKALERLTDHVQVEKELNDYFEEAEDSDSSEDSIDKMPMMSEYEKKRLAKWDNMIESLNSMKKEN